MLILFIAELFKCNYSLDSQSSARRWEFCNDWNGNGVLFITAMFFMFMFLGFRLDGNAVDTNGMEL